ncbi:MAG: hypothetical protein CMO81_01480 [Waddliaceae bacterium]|nr:hypothetical protein [Waddliaceae bacterium]
MRWLKNGLILLFPLALTLLLIGWMIPMLDLTFRPLLSLFFNNKDMSTTFVISMGLGVMLVLALLIQAPLISFFYRVAEGLIQRIPFVGPIYKSLLDATQLVSGKGGAAQGKAVMIKKDGLTLIGLMTQESLQGRLAAIQSEEEEPLVAVYLPLSYQVGGYTVFIPKSQVKELDWTPTQVMQICLSGAVIKPK